MSSRKMIVRCCAAAWKAVPKPSTPKQIVFVGPPQSGKTVFFAAMIDRLIRQSTEGRSPLLLHAANRESCNFVTDVMVGLAKQVWPREGGAKETHGTLEYHLQRKICGIRTSRILRCCDYAGEAFQGAFGDPKHRTVDVSADLVAKLREDINSASGVFYVMDAVQLHDGGCRVTQDCLFGLTDELLRQRKKVGIIFTKRDVFDGTRFTPREKLREEYPDAWTKLTAMRARSIFVSSVGATEVNDAGVQVPRKGCKSRDAKWLLQPINWMLGIGGKDSDQD